MSLYRFFKRRLSFLGILLIVTIFWIFYMILSAPAASDHRFHNGALPGDQGKAVSRDSVTRKVIAQPLQPQDYVNLEKLEEKQILPPREEDIRGQAVDVPEKQAIPRPPPDDDTDALAEHVKPFGDTNQALIVNVDNVAGLQDSPSENKGNQAETKVNTDSKDKGKPLSETVKSEGNNAQKLSNTTIMKIPTKKVNNTVKAGNITNPPVLKNVKDNVFQFGESLKNKTFGDWEKVKNKTIEKLTDLGVIKKPKYIKLIYTPVKWNLNLSIEDIGNIMKDTKYFQVKQNLTEMEYQPLLSPNSTEKLNFTEARKYGLGYCDCKDLECMCCVRLFSKTMRLNSTACSLLTFSSKSQELQFVYSIDKTPVFDRKIADDKDLVCLMTRKFVDATSQMRNFLQKYAWSPHRKLQVSVPYSQMLLQK